MFSRARMTSAFLFVAIPSALVLVQPGVASAADTVGVTCASAGKVFIVDGTNDNPANYHTKGVADRYPGYEIDHVVYPATIWPEGVDSYASSAAAGQKALDAGIVTYRSTPGCAQSPVVIVGYSQGAAIAGDELHAIAVDPDSTIATTDSQGRPIVSGELYSDPRRTGDARGRGVELSMVGVIPGLIMRGPRGPGGYGEIPVLDVCVQGDPICDLPDPLHDPIGAADALLGFGTKHFEYDQYMLDPTALGAGVAPTGTVLLPRPMAFSVILAGVGIHAFDNVHSVYIPLPYPELASFQPYIAFFQGLGPQYPSLGHGATLPDLFTVIDAVHGNAAAQARLLVSLKGIGHYPSAFLTDATSTIRARLTGGQSVSAPAVARSSAPRPEQSASPTSATGSTTPPGSLRRVLTHAVGQVSEHLRDRMSPAPTSRPSSVPPSGSAAFTAPSASPSSTVPSQGAESTADAPETSHLVDVAHDAPSDDGS